MTVHHSGGPSQAMHRLERLRDLDRAEVLPAALRYRLDEAEIDCRLQLGDVEGALLVGRSSSLQGIARESLARLDLRAGRPDQVLVRLSTGRSPDLAGHIRRLVIQACAESQCGRRQRALDTMRRAIEAARPEAYVRPFLEEATQTLPLLRNAASYGSDRYLSEVTRQAEGLVTSATPRAVGTTLEPLTERERQVLYYLPSHYTLR
jgi:MalT-like TPR region